MKYTDSYINLNKAFSSVISKFEFDNLEIHKFEFKSSSYNILPGNSEYHCGIHNIKFNDSISFYHDIESTQADIYTKDFEVEVNRNFKYYILKPRNNKSVKKVTFMLHGFNEKHWDKYYAWGQAICEGTGTAIVFFPIAFHMQRAPIEWSEKREMFSLSERRKKEFPNIVGSTLSNVAISMRLHSMPQRFIWGGLQTYYDIIQFIENCKQGKHALIDKDFTFDIFAYSIGGLLAEILKLANYNGYLTDSKICLFCSGAVFNRLSPVSKYILDSETNIALYSYLIEHLDSYLKKDALLRHYLDEDHLEGKILHSMLNFHKMRDFRESLFEKNNNYFYAIALKKDHVIPSYEIMNTLQGAYRNIDITVDELDFDFLYSHEMPFPVEHTDHQKANESFNIIFDKVCRFLNK